MSDTQKILPLNQLEPNPLQPREKIKKEDIAELTDSIKQHGLLEPLVVAQTPAGYQIIAGERRWRAAKEAGLTEVPVHIVKTSRKGMLEMAIVENVQRADLHPLERAQAFHRLKHEFDLPTSEISARINKSDSYVANTLKLLKLPDAVKDGLVSGLITEGHARALAQIKSEKFIIESYKIILKENGTVRRAEELARYYTDMAAIENRSKGVSKAVRARVKLDARLPQWQERLQSRLHTDAKLQVTRSLRQTRVVITLKGDVETTETDLSKLIELVTVPTQSDIP